MKTIVNLINFPYFSEQSHLRKLNRHVQIQDDFMLHQISGATGCTQKDALGILILLYLQGLGYLYLLIYHCDDLGMPIETRKFSDGPPRPPFVNPSTDIMIESLDELEYDIQFRLGADVRIKFEFV